MQNPRSAGALSALLGAFIGLGCGGCGGSSSQGGSVGTEVPPPGPGIDALPAGWNRIEPGGNYGWPDVEGEGGDPRYADPIATWSPTSEASPSGAEILVNGAIPQWEGDFFMAGLRGQRLFRLDLDERGNVTEREEFLRGEAGRLRHVEQAPDGSLWVLTNNRDGRGNPIADDDRILRLGPASG